MKMPDESCISIVDSAFGIIFGCIAGVPLLVVILVTDWIYLINEVEIMPVTPVGTECVGVRWVCWYSLNSITPGGLWPDPWGVIPELDARESIAPRVPGGAETWAFDGANACNEIAVAPGGIDAKYTYFVFGVLITASKGSASPGGADVKGDKCRILLDVICRADVTDYIDVMIFECIELAPVFLLDNRCCTLFKSVMIWCTLSLTRSGASPTFVVAVLRPSPEPRPALVSTAVAGSVSRVRSPACVGCSAVLHGHVECDVDSRAIYGSTPC